MIRVQLEPGVTFRCSCGEHSLTPESVYRLRWCVRVCKTCNEILQPVDKLPEIEPGEPVQSVFLCCELTDKGEHVLTYDTSQCPEVNFPPPRIALNETDRRAVVRALYRQGDLDDLEDEYIIRRARELLNKS